MIEDTPSIDRSDEHDDADRPRAGEAEARDVARRGKSFSETLADLGEAGAPADEGAPPATGSKLVLVTGRAGAGRTTAINALEDLGFERIDTPPLAFVPAILRRLLDGAPRRVAVGVHARSIDFSVENFLTMRAALDEIPNLETSVVFLDGHDEALRRRYTETRRRHPMAPGETLERGLELDRREMAPLRGHADVVIDTSEMTTADLRRSLHRHLAASKAVGPTLSIVSFAYKHGLPVDADLVFDCRFLRNPHYEASMRMMDGRDASVRDYIAADDRFERFVGLLREQARLLLPAFDAEGKSYVTIAFGCTGGRHRSVALAELFSQTAAELGWRPLIRHRELAREQGEDAAGAHASSASRGDAA